MWKSLLAPIGGIVGNMIAPGIGGAIGSSIGGMIGGRGRQQTPPQQQHGLLSPNVTPTAVGLPQGVQMPQGGFSPHTGAGRFVDPSIFQQQQIPNGATNTQLGGFLGSGTIGERLAGAGTQQRWGYGANTGYQNQLNNQMSRLRGFRGNIPYGGSYSGGAGMGMFDPSMMRRMR